MTTADVTDFPDLLDPQTFGSGRPGELFDRLAERQIVRVESRSEQTEFWAVGSHAEVGALARDWRRLSSAAAGTILRGRPGTNPNSLTDLDPPRHTELRRPLTKAFKASQLARLEPVAREAARQALAGLAAHGPGADFVAAARMVPAAVVGELLDIPLEYRDQAALLGHLVNFVEDPAFADLVAQMRPHENLAALAHELAARERRTPRGGVMSNLLAVGEGGPPLTVAELEAMVMLLVAAGNGTTIDALVGAVDLLQRNPDAAALLRDADADTYRCAVEEVLRWATPVHYFARTALEPLEVAGQAIEPGDRLALYFAAANVDPRVFVEPYRFDPRRRPNPHLAFGLGVHACLGAPLARLEIRIMLEELCRNYVVTSVAATRIVSHINNAYSSVEISLDRRPDCVR